MRQPDDGDRSAASRAPDSLPPEGRTSEASRPARVAGVPVAGADTASAPYRNLRVWSEGFALALEILQMTRDIEGETGRRISGRLIDASARVPVAIARGQSSGSVTRFIRSLHEAQSDLSEVENHLLICGEIGILPAARVEAGAARAGRIRLMAAALIRRLAASRRGGRPSAGARETGSALLLSLIVAAALGALGLTILGIADLESAIAARARDRDQLMYVAETGARAIKAWFDAPVTGDPGGASTPSHLALGSLDPRDPGAFNLGRRLVDSDGDPLTAPVTADGTPGRETYRQGREIHPPAPHLDFFHKPWRGDLSVTLVGPEDGPDLVLEDTPGIVDLLDRLNARLFTDQATMGRLEKIEIYGPPVEPGAAHQPRLGIATLKVTAARYRRMASLSGVPVVLPGDRPVARSIVRAGLAEVPVGAPRGPLESCGDIVARGVLRARWGRVIAVGDITLADHLDTLDRTVASAFPYASFDRHITGRSPGGNLAAWLGNADDSIEDPWLKVIAGGNLIGYAALPDQPFPFSPSRQIDFDHSNLFQRVAGVSCPSFDYATWKNIVTRRLRGDRHARYFVYDPPTGLFRENGAGAARSVRDWTHREQGIFFFDTADGRAPKGSNLTPPVRIAGGEWSTAGFIYLNAASFRAESVTGTRRVLVPPGEPFDDADHDLAHGPSEEFVNLFYATTAGAGGPTDDMLKNPPAGQSGTASSPDGETYHGATTAGRDAAGLPMLAEINIFGVLFNAGDIVAEGDAVHFGSLVAGRDVIQTTAGADTPVVYFDERLNTGRWPPPEIAMPRTFVTFWQTSRP